MRKLLPFLLINLLLQYFGAHHFLLNPLINLLLLNIAIHTLALPQTKHRRPITSTNPRTNPHTTNLTGLVLHHRQAPQLINALSHPVDGFAQSVVEHFVFVEQVLFGLVFEQVLDFGDVYCFVLLLLVFLAVYWAQAYLQEFLAWASALLLCYLQAVES